MNQLVKVIMGPPGTGKTTALIVAVVNAVRSGVKPERIAYTAFTNTAADEAGARAIKALGLRIPAGKTSTAVLPGFSTLHSACYRALDLRKGDLMVAKDWKEFSAKVGEPMVATNNKQFYLSSPKRGDRMHAADEMARTMCMPLEEGWRRCNGGIIQLPFQQRFSEALLRFKEDRGKNDFTDMLTRVPRECEALDLDLAIIDEAQDLTMAQWHAALHLFAKTPVLIVAGDDDQAIFEWAGAAVSFFQNLPGELVVLPKSYRLGRKVKALADTITARIRQRVPKEWDDSGEESEVIRQQLHLINPGGEETWMYLARNNYHLEQVQKLLRQRGYLFHDADNEGELAAIRAWEALAVENSAPGTDVLRMIPLVHKDLDAQIERHGAVAELGHYNCAELGLDHKIVKELRWWDALPGIPRHNVAYYQDCFRRGETTHPRITLSSIHGAKGLQADNVVLITDWSRSVNNEFPYSVDEEHRVMYVGATRAKKRLFLPPRLTSKGYNL
jgi:ATP-dependent DNA helicase UvrD/PcrA